MTILSEKRKGQGHTGNMYQGKDMVSHVFCCPSNHCTVLPFIFHHGMITCQSQMQTSAWSDKEKDNTGEHVRGYNFTA